MQILDVRLWLLVALSVAAGVAVGWLVWGRQLDRQRSRYRAMLDGAKRNWELVEDRLSTALDDLAVLNALFAKRGEELEALQRAVTRQQHAQSVRTSSTTQTLYAQQASELRERETT